MRSLQKCEQFAKPATGSRGTAVKTTRKLGNVTHPKKRNQPTLGLFSICLGRQVARYSICYYCFKHLIVLSSGWLWGNKRGVIMMTNNLWHSKYCITLNSGAMQACFENEAMPRYAISSMKSVYYVLYQDRRKGIDKCML